MLAGFRAVARYQARLENAARFFESAVGNCREWIGTPWPTVKRMIKTHSFIRFAAVASQMRFRAQMYCYVPAWDDQ